MEIQTLVDLGALLITGAGFLFAGYQFQRGVVQYHRDQVWRRKEFVAGEYEKIVGNERSYAALVMLDWSRRRLALPGHDVIVDSDVLGRALIPHQIPGRPDWTPDDAVIRDCFDALLERLATLEVMLSEGLIQEADLKPYLTYWIRLIAGVDRRHSLEAIRNLHLYIEAYFPDHVRALVKRFGPEIQPKPDDKDALMVEIQAGRWARPDEE